jgi:hypothetical protein
MSEESKRTALAVLFSFSVKKKVKQDKYGDKLYERNMRACASEARSTVRRFLTLVKLSRDYDIRKIVLNPTVSNKLLEQLTGGYGYPDFRKECVEEKGPRKDYLTLSQWARSILEYRSDRPYRVAWRFSLTRRRIFPDVFSFYEWQLKHLKPRKSKGKKR